MKYERLTKRTENNGVKYDRNDFVRTCYPQNEYAHDDIDRMAIRLAEYEDDLESGKIVRLPCKVGDTVYKIMHVCGKRRAVEFIVSRISISSKEICIYFHKSKESWHEWCTKPHHFGVNVFLTSEEAEAKLKELQNG